MHWSWLATLYSVPNKSYQLQMVWEIWSNYHFTLTCYIQKEYRFKNKTWNKQVNKHSKYNKIAIKTDEMHVGQCFSRYKCIHVYTKHNSNFNQSLSLQHAYVYLLFCVICIHLTNSTNKTFQHVGTKKNSKNIELYASRRIIFNAMKLYEFNSKPSFWARVIFFVLAISLTLIFTNEN